jgi:hypothetical protein
MEGIDTRSSNRLFVRILLKGRLLRAVYADGRRLVDLELG